jgi:hypothetical protein
LSKGFITWQSGVMNVSSGPQPVQLKSLDVIHAGETTFPMDKKIRAVAFRRLLQDINPLM